MGAKKSSEAILQAAECDERDARGRIKIREQIDVGERPRLTASNRAKQA